MDAIHWHSFFFLLFALAACAFAVAVVIAGNVVRMAFYLVMSLAAVAGMFFLAGAAFLGAMQLMVYVGGTLVLLAFGVMLTARGPFVSIRSSGGQWILAALIAGSMLAVLVQTLVRVAPPAAGESAAAASAAFEEQATAAELGMGLLGIRTDQLGSAALDAKGLSRTPGYFLVFEIISVHLLVVLVGAAYLARAKRKRTSPSA